MEIDASILVAILSLGVSLYIGISNMKRNRTHDDRSDATQLTTVIVKLENIGMGISDIKSEMRNVKDEVRDLRDRLIKTEDSVKSAHRRIDELHFLDKGGVTSE